MKRKSTRTTATIKLPKPSRREISRTATIVINELNNQEKGVNIDFKDSQVRNTGSRMFDAICHMVKGNIEDMCSDLGNALGDRLTKQQQKQNEVDDLIIKHTMLKRDLANIKEEIRLITLSLNPSQDHELLTQKIKAVKRNLINLIK